MNSSPKKKNNDAPKQADLKSSDTGSAKSTESVSKASPTSDSKPPVKSASQTSISHFSSVSTPEYREGWNRIFGKQEGQEKLTSSLNHDKVRLQELSILDTNIDTQTKTILRTVFVNHASRQGIELFDFDKCVSESYELKLVLKK